MQADLHRISCKESISAEIYKKEGAKDLEALCDVLQNILEEKRMLNIYCGVSTHEQRK